MAMYPLSLTYNFFYIISLRADLENLTLLKLMKFHFLKDVKLKVINYLISLIIIDFYLII